ncbi:unnamed protein product [Moneuplotes crassus]|uniref:Uncharacterized protein n=1 Tax=Euplotes crassus TaxID=5936 RepID=A0A7S3NU40_EUPCR|nr:unnamed protein product [Moneuplotes crassus]|mmetsp:Transcript_17378/g.17093  ORF Transcript_17378/g.17093 Transcript_17378/m.17093 type:complete len:303 (+) Transcript_17378:21-929(+)|eukprot:CAMPEP_0197004422 /NCGR_PEP_ID=MMETSP1380-20130617/22407_1 /TAXON_ID=5936 /ORGANISM="Euplotes crassus, Strain CT5" /LENGTH=302 /DNA_ID=CAMNT_0042423195 /DNA_START=21 /DNA_END=929 /DNA_ORIENTATION=+
MDWDNSRRHVVLHAPPGGKTSISIFGNEDNDPQDYKKPGPAYAPPPSYGAPPEPAYSAPSQPSYGGHSAAGPSPGYGYSEPQADPTPPAHYGGSYGAPAASSGPSYDGGYGSYQPSAPTEVTTFGVKKEMRSEMNIGADGNERSSVKVHHPPGGGGSLNLFGAEEPAHSAPEPKYGGGYQAPQESSYAPPPSYGHHEPSPGHASAGDFCPPPSYGGGAPATYGAPPEEVKQTYPSYGAAPSGFTPSAVYSDPQPIHPSDLNVTSAPTTFGQRVESGLNSGPTTDKSSIRVHAPPGGQSSIFF